MKKFAFFLLLVLSVFNVVNLFLVVPPTSPTRHQLISGIGIPLQLENEAITMGLVLKAQYFLPDTPNQLKFNFFPDVFKPYDKDFLWDIVQQKFPNGRKRREISYDPLTGENVEKYQEELVEISNSPLNKTDFSYREAYDANYDEEDDDDFDDQFEEDIQDKKLLRQFFSQQRNGNGVDKDNKSDDVDLSSTRWIAYDALGRTLDSKGFNGRICVLRGICEASESPFSFEESLMGQLFHIFFSPSTTSEPVSKSSDYDYIKAESIGKDSGGSDCKKAFHECKNSIMEIFTEIDNNPMFQFQ